MENTDDKNLNTTIGNTVLGEVNGGIELIGKKVGIWKESKNGRFLAKGIIVDYHKSKDKGRGKNTITKGKYLIDFGNKKKYWHTMSEFNFA